MIPIHLPKRGQFLWLPIVQQFEVLRLQSSDRPIEFIDREHIQNNVMDRSISAFSFFMGTRDERNGGCG
jgi:hypothetical protein